tara:strand:+ start:3702 stop:3911 length:210 start_codon:yes stop_codon:yes gene_type:complete
MNINKVVALLVELYEFLNSRKVGYAVIISQILNEVTSAQTDLEKLFIIETAQKNCKEEYRTGLRNLLKE